MNSSEKIARQALISYRNGHIGLNDLAKGMYPLIKKISSAAAYNIKMDVAEDIASMVWLAMQTKGIQQWDDTRSLGAYLVRIARNISLGIVNENTLYAAPKTGEEGDEIDTTEEVEDSISLNHSTSDPADIISKKIAIDTIKQKLLHSKGIGNMADNDSGIASPYDMSKQRTQQKSQVKNKLNKKFYTLSPDQQELSDIYHRLHENEGVTQDAFAKRLNIGSARLASYLYGRTFGVPAHIMESARAIGKSPENTKNIFEGVEMINILRQWAERLGINGLDDAKLSKLIGVSVSTVCRWRNGETRPSNVELMRYDRIVAAVAGKLSKADV